MTLIEPTYAETAAALRAVVADVGENYVYPESERSDDGPAGEGNQCRYVYEGRPSCLVGRALVRLGVPVETLALHEGKGAHTVWLNLYGGWSGQGWAVTILCLAQKSQDEGDTFGVALRTALAHHE